MSENQAGRSARYEKQTKTRLRQPLTAPAVNPRMK